MKSSTLHIFAALSALTGLASAQNPAVLPWNEMDLGPFHSGTFKINGQPTVKGIAIRTGGTRATGQVGGTILFDTELLRMSAAWTGEYLKFPKSRGGLEGQIAAGGSVFFSTSNVPGWTTGELINDPRPAGQGNLPKTTARWRGLSVHGAHCVLRYEVAGVGILESPAMETRGDSTVFTRTFRIEPSKSALTLYLLQVPESTAEIQGATARLKHKAPVDAGVKQEVTTILAAHAPKGAVIECDALGRAVLKLPASDAVQSFQVVLSQNTVDALPEVAALTPQVVPDLSEWLKPAAARWGEPLVQAGKTGGDEAAYVNDEITIPEPNRFGSWLRLGGHDFFPDGRAAVANLSGDLWLVSGLDRDLANVKWQRFATGLFQPLGVKIVDGVVYVLGRDQITRLHDLNNDGEADFYENFNNDCVATENYHEFSLDLQTDSQGNFYFGKGAPWTPDVVSPHQGCLLRVSKDGSTLSIVATGLRAPNGLGMGPGDFLSCSDNQGHWVPANRLNVIKEGGFYGMVPAAHRTMTMKLANGSELQMDPSSPVARAARKLRVWGDAKVPVPTEGMEPPLVWLPQNVDNSPGGEVWVTSNQWGPWKDRMLHLSYGKCILYGVMMEKAGDRMQGGVVKFPFKFTSGIMRGRFSPVDGQLYMTGLNVWQSDGARLGCFHRVRYTGKAVCMPIELKASKRGLKITFTGAVDAASADKDSFDLKRWNYRWTGAYGSAEYSVSEPETKGKEDLTITAVRVSADGRELELDVDDMRPAMQMHLTYEVKGADGQKLQQEIYHTVHTLSE